MRHKHLFGPVPSRRLGRSLGVDLIPFKTCSYNCVYCECGATTNLTTEREEYVSADDVIFELKDFLYKNSELAYITFAGSGEPTLNRGVAKIIDFLKKSYPEYKIAVLTNGSLFYKEEVRREILKADLVMPSLDAVSEQTFHKINRPHKNLKIQKIVSGLIEFRKIFDGELWLEVFIVPEINDTKEELKLLRNAIEKINPDRIQINSLDRPGTENWVSPADEIHLSNIISYLRDLPIEIIAEFNLRNQIAGFDHNIEEKILATIKRRPCTANDLSYSLGIHIDVINNCLQSLLMEKRVRSRSIGRGVFFNAPD